MTRNWFKTLGQLAGYVTVPLLIVLALGFVAVRRFEWYIIVGLILLIICIALFAATNPEVWQRRLGRQRVSSTISGVVIIIALVGIIALVNVLLQRTNVQFDLTKNKNFTISDSSAQIVEKLNTQTTALIFYNQTSTAQQQQASDLLKQYAARNGKLLIQSINADQDPVSVQRYGVTANPTVVFEQGQRRESTTSVDEQSFSRTLLKLQNAPKRALIVTGHQELPTTASQNGNSLSNIVQALTQNNYTVELYNSVAGTSAPVAAAAADPSQPAPAGTATQLNPASDILLIIGPRSKFSDTEKQRFTTFFKQGGKAMIAYDITGNTQADATQTTNLNDLLTDFGVKFDRGLAVEADATRHAQQSAALILPQPNASSDITRDFGAQDMVVANSSAVEKNADSKATFTQLLTTSANSYLKTKLPPTTAELEQGDVRGPLTVAATVELPASQPAPAITSTTPITGTTTPAATPTPVPTAPTDNTSRLVLLGSAVSLSDQLVQATRNSDFFLNSMNYLSATGNNLVIPTKQADTQPFTLNSGQSGLIFWGSFLGLPVLILFVGLVAWWRRR